MWGGVRCGVPHQECAAVSGILPVVVLVGVRRWWIPTPVGLSKKDKHLFTWCLGHSLLPATPLPKG